MSVKFLLSLARLPGTDFLTNKKYIYKHHLKQHESHSYGRNEKSEVGGPSRKVWVEVCCQGQTLLTLLKTKIVHLLPLLNQEILCYEPDSFCFTQRINNFLKMTSWNCSAAHTCLGQIREYPPPPLRIGIWLRCHVIKYQTLKQPVGYRDSKHRQYKTLCKATYMHFQ